MTAWPTFFYHHETRSQESETYGTVGTILNDPVAFFEVHKFREHIIRSRRVDLDQISEHHLQVNPNHPQ